MKKIKIYTRLHLYAHAKQLAKILRELNFDAELIYEVDATCEDLHILYCAFNVKQLPKNYICYQTEQGASPFWNEYYNYRKIIADALQLWEWNEASFNAYMFEENRPRVYLVPPGLIKPLISEKDIPVLFYGLLNNHRNLILEAIKGRFNVKVITDTYGEEMQMILSRAKVVLNIPYYIPGSLETFRINEALCCDCTIVTERRPECYFPEKYKDLIYTGASPNELIFNIKKALEVPIKKDLSVLDNREYVRAAIEKL